MKKTSPLVDRFQRFATGELCKQERRERKELLRSIEFLPGHEGPALPRHSLRVAGRSE